MKWYLKDYEIGKIGGELMYSSELGHILKFKTKVKFRCVNTEDLFWLIETLGDLM